LAGFGVVARVDLAHPAKASQCARDFDRRGPPDNQLIALVKFDGPRRDVLTHAKRNQCACIPKSRGPHYRLSRSSRHICSMTSLETFPGGSGHDTLAGRFFNGGARTPRAISRCSCTGCSSKRHGTIRATGLLRSQTSTSSPSRTSWIWALSCAFRLLIFTVFIRGL